MSATAAPVPAPAPAAEPRRRGRGHRRARERLVLLAQLGPITAFFAAFLLAPLAIFFVYSLWKLEGFHIVQDWSLSAYKEVITDPITRKLIWNTVKIGLGVSIATVLIAYTFAHVIRFHLRRWQAPLLFLVLMAMFSGYLVRIYAWTTILGNNGIINKTLEQLGVIDHPMTFLLYSRAAAIIVLTNFLVPLAILPIYAALQNVGDREIEAARDLGCGSRKALRKVIIPLAWPGIFAAWALTFIIATGDYITPQLVGGTSGTMIGQIVALEFNQSFNWPQGAALSFLSLAVILAIIGLVRLAGKLVVVR
ncbi:MAG: ABC transporter permease [Actinobacteria bacterium]|nr:ABC transporter permease [Actinomycetota bacterium]